MDMKKFARGCLDDSQRWFGMGIGYSESGMKTRTFHDAVVHHGLGVAGEAGEVAEAIKKWDRGSIDDVQLKVKMEEELTDVLIYLGNIAGLLDIDLEDSYNIKREFNERRFGHGND